MTMKHLAAATAALAGLGAAARATDLSDNLSQSTGGIESATDVRWIASSFATDANTYTLTSVTLLLANSASGAAQLSVYTDSGLEPGTLVGVLTSPGSYPTSLAQTTFTSGSIQLSPSTTYWVVLRALSGQFDWAWAGDIGGSGVGFQHQWAVTPDTAASWWSANTYPTQMRVSATLGAVCYANCDGSTTAPVLNVLDFSCFLNRFAAGDTWANCDGSTTAPVLNVLDFSCFLNSFAAGCT